MNAQKSYDSELAAANERAQVTHTGTTLLSPIHSVSNDIMCLIIDFACADEHSQCFKNVWTQSPPPISTITRPRGPLWCLSNTSRRIRTLTCGLPKLWRCVHIGYRHDHRLAVETQLQRSQDQPLHIVIDVDRERKSARDLLLSRSASTSETRELASFQHTWDILQAEMHRWEYFSLFARNNQAFLNIVRTSDIELPSLKGLYISSSSIYDGTFLKGGRAISAPNVSMLRTAHADICLASSASSMSRLTAVCFHPFVPRVDPRSWPYSGSLAQIANVQTLMLHRVVFAHPGRSSVTTEPALLPRLRYLELAECRGDGNLHNAPAISAPSLHTLKINRTQLEHVADMISIANGLGHVQHLSLVQLAYTFGSDHRSQLFSYMPEVVFIQLEHQEDFPCILASNGPVFRRLESIQYTTSTIDGEALLHLVHARASLAEHPLKRLVVSPAAENSVRKVLHGTAIRVEQSDERYEDPFIEATWPRSL